MTKFYDDAWSFKCVRGCLFIKYCIDVWEMAISHSNGWRQWASVKCACKWCQLGGKNTHRSLLVLAPTLAVWLRLRLRQGFIQHKITYESFTSGLHCKTIRTYWTKYEPGIIKNTCWETCTKIIADRFRRGHPEGVFPNSGLDQNSGPASDLEPGPESSWASTYWPADSSVDQGLYSLSGKTSYRKISSSLEAARFGFGLFQLLWNLTGIQYACQISERYDHYNTQSRSFKTSRDLAVRRLTA